MPNSFLKIVPHHFHFRKKFYLQESIFDRLNIFMATFPVKNEILSTFVQALIKGQFWGDHFAPPFFVWEDFLIPRWNSVTNEIKKKRI